MSELAMLGGPRAIANMVPESPYDDANDAVAAALQSVRAPELSSLTGAGPIAELERRFREHLNGRHTLGVSSGTAALHVVLAACGVQPGDEVIVPAYDWGAAAAAVLAVGAVPVFADIAPETYTLDLAAARAALSTRTTAIVTTHLFGHPATTKEIADLCRQRGILLMEDCAQAWGAAYYDRPVGTLGDAAAFSLGHGKSLPAGEGGVAVFRRAEDYERAVHFCQHPLRQAREGVSVNRFALNYRLHPLTAVVALAQWDYAARRIAQRRAMAEALTAALGVQPGIRPVAVAEGCEHAFARYCPTFQPEAWDGESREIVVQALAAEGVPITGMVVGQALHRDPALRQRPHKATDCPVAERRCALEELAIDYGRETLVLDEGGIAGIRMALGKVRARIDELRLLSEIESSK